MAQSGHCLCGAVRFTADRAASTIHACHCDMCRRWTGGPEYGVDCEGVRFEDETKIGVYRSSDWAERAFCRVCGAALYYRLLGGSAISIAPGLFDDQSRFRLTEEIFVDERPPWVPAAPGAAQKTGAQAIAEFNESGS